MDPTETFGGIFGWLRGVGMSQVSRFDLLPYFVVQTLDLELYRFSLDSIALTPGSNDPIGTFQWVSVWLHGPSMF